jgi:hypothetical protein
VLVLKGRHACHGDAEVIWLMCTAKGCSAGRECAEQAS